MPDTTAYPVQFSILEMTCGHTLLKVDFGQESKVLTIANNSSCDFIDLMQWLFWVNPVFYRGSLGELRKLPGRAIIYETETDAYKLHWNSESSGIDLTLRPVGVIPDADVELKLAIDNDIWIQTAIPYKALSYVVVKAINDRMAKQGLLGIFWSKESTQFNLRPFLHLKAFAMDLGPIDEFDGFTSYSNLEDDLKLLALPMP